MSRMTRKGRVSSIAGSFVIVASEEGPTYSGQLVVDEVGTLKVEPLPDALERPDRPKAADK